MFHSPQRIIKFASLLLVCLLVTLSSFAQDPRGTVLGRVVDATGAVVPNAEVRIVNDATGVAASAKTNDAGNFTLPYLLTGTYTLSCEQSGFKKWIRPGIQVRIQDTVEVDIDLAIGSTSETMEVKETTPLLSTRRSFPRPGHR